MVADAGANALWLVTNGGRIKTLAVLPPQPFTFDAASVAALGLPNCFLGVTYAFEAVPTDVEVGRDGFLYVTTLPGGPESPALGARGKVYRVNPWTGRAKVVAAGFLGATNLALGHNGSMYVAELFGGVITKVKHGRRSTFADLPGVVAVESGPDGSLWAGTLGSEAGPGTIVKFENGRFHREGTVRTRPVREASAADLDGRRRMSARVELSLVLVAREVEVRAGARLLLSPVSFQVSAGDKVGLVGRNGAGKTTLTKILAGEALPAAGQITRSGQIGYLPQDPRTGDLDSLAKDRILSARGLDAILRRLLKYSTEMATENGDAQEQAMMSYARAENELTAAGGYAAEAEAARIAANLALPDRVLGSRCAPCPAVSGGGLSWPGSCSPGPTTCCWTNPPTTWTPTRSSGCAST